MDVTSLSQIGPYRVERFIDAGAFAWVFEVRDPKFVGRRLALKMLMPEAAEGQELRRFESEARLLAQIDHPNVVTIFDFGRDDDTGNFYYVMTFVDGPTLKTRLKQSSMTVDEALPIFVGLLDGLARIHDNGIVHRDIKPANVLLGDDGRARLADLGIARVQAERSQTRTGVAVGTALYMSPEQARGRDVDPRSDLFSMALTLYECLTGNVIYDHVESIDSSSGMDVLMYIGSLVHTRQEFEVRFDGESTVPESVQRIILKCLRLDPEQRFGSAREVRDALRGAMQQGTAPAPVVHHPVAAPSPSRAFLAAGGALAVGLILAGLYFFYLAPRQRVAEVAARTQSEIEALAGVGEQALAVASAVRDLQTADDSAVLARVDEHVDRGDRYLQDGTADALVGSFDVALRNLERGREQYATACAVVLDEVLVARVGGAASALRERAMAMADRGAQEVVPKAWSALAGVLPRAEAQVAGTTGCASAEVELARLIAVEEAAPLADAVEDELGRAWPRVLDAAYEQAATARLVAVAVPSQAREYRLALKEAKRFLLQGSRHRRAGEDQAARNAYRSAEKGFQVAARIAPAALSRDEVGALAEQIAQENAADIGEIAQQIEEGDAAYAAERWEQARTHFDEAGTALKELRQATEWRRAAIAARDVAQPARTAAVEAGARQSAPTEFDQAEASVARGERGLESGDARQAEISFVTARDEFEASKMRAIQALRDAGMKRATVIVTSEDLLAGSRCADLDPGGGKGECVAAEEALAAGDTAVAALDAPAAVRHFSLALESFARARSAQVLWEATRPRPPVLVRRVPQRAVVEASPRQLYSFGVEARDPNGDMLAYRWTIDGVSQSDEQGPTMKRRLEQGAVIAVTIDDGRGGELIEQWRVEIVDRSAGG